MDHYYTANAQEKGKLGTHGPLWEFRNIPSFLVYRMYYHKMEINRDIFTPVAPRPVTLPLERPDNVWHWAIHNWSPIAGSGRSGESNSTQVERSVALKSDQEAEKISGENSANNIAQVESNARLDLIMEIKARLELLSEMENIFPKQRMMKETKKLLSALPPPLAASEVKDRQAAILEAQLRVELLKKVKNSLTAKRFAKEMRQMFNGLPLLPINKEKMNKQKDTKTEIKGEEGWEYVNSENPVNSEMNDVNAAVDSLDIA